MHFGQPRWTYRSGAPCSPPSRTRRSRCGCSSTVAFIPAEAVPRCSPGRADSLFLAEGPPHPDARAAATRGRGAGGAREVRRHPQGPPAHRGGNPEVVGRGGGRAGPRRGRQGPKRPGWSSPAWPARSRSGPPPPRRASTASARSSRGCGPSTAASPARWRGTSSTTRRSAPSCGRRGTRHDRLPPLPPRRPRARRRRAVPGLRRRSRPWRTGPTRSCSGSMPRWCVTWRRWIVSTSRAGAFPIAGRSRMPTGSRSTRR